MAGFEVIIYGRFWVITEVLSSQSWTNQARFRHFDGTYGICGKTLYQSRFLIGFVQALSSIAV